MTGQPDEDASVAPAVRSSTTSVLRLAGPGLVVAAVGIGSGDVVSATVGGANFGAVVPNRPSNASMWK